MGNQNDDRAWPSVLRRLFDAFSLDRISLVLDLAQRLRRILCSGPNELYEILDYAASVELLDTTGRRAVFKKRQRVRFLQDNIIALEDYAWGDGNILVDYRCTPGVVVDKYREGDRWNILISLRETRGAGDIEEFHIERTEKNTFTKTEEWLQTEIRHRTRRLRMSIIFPRKRRCRRAVLVQRKFNRTTVLGLEHFGTLPDGRQLITWKTSHVDAYDIYTLKWLW